MHLLALHIIPTSLYSFLLSAIGLHAFFEVGFYSVTICFLRAMRCCR